MGVRCVAVYSDADAGAKHVQMADEAVHIGGPAPADSYLKGDVIIEAALDTAARRRSIPAMVSCPRTRTSSTGRGRADLHRPVRRCDPRDGAEGRCQAADGEAGVPVVPGYHGDNQDAEHLAAEAADTIGYPVLIKAVAGGGGKGMRLVTDPGDFAAALDSAQRRGRPLWQRCGADREIRQQAAPYRGAGVWRRHGMPCICSSAIARCSAATRR